VLPHVPSGTLAAALPFWQQQQQQSLQLHWLAKPATAAHLCACLPASLPPSFCPEMQIPGPRHTRQVSLRVPGVAGNGSRRRPVAAALRPHAPVPPTLWCSNGYAPRTAQRW
jgi:hypothetical protein